MQKTFYVGFAFMKHESTFYYRWCMKILRNIFGICDVYGKPLILTDKENALIAAIEEVIPGEAIYMLCQWHIHKNILMHVTKAFGDDVEDMAKWNQAWFAVLNASTEVEYLAAEEDLLFLEPTDTPEPLFDVHKEWLKDGKQEKFVKAWTDKHLHFSHKATSTGEGVHGKLKRRLLTSTGDLTTVVTEVHHLIIAELEEIRIHHEEQKMQLLPKHRIGPF